MLNSTPLPTRFAPAERAPRELVERQSALFSGAVLTTEVLEAMPEVVTVLNGHRQIVYANRKLLHLLGITQLGAVLGQRPGEVLNCLHAVESDGGCGTTEFCSTCGAVKAILASQAGHANEQECRISQQNGDSLDLRVHATPLDVQGEKFTIFSLSDISGEKRRRVLERVFFHDLLNTAGGIMGFAELIKMSPPEDVLEYTDSIHEVATTLVEEIRAQKTLVAAETNELSVYPEAVSAQQMLQEVMDSYKAHEVAQGKALVLDANCPGVELMTDKTLLKRVLGNLVKNALEASPAGGTVSASCRADANGVEFAVHNVAVMPRNVQLQVFQRSFSTKGAGRGVGTYSIKLLTERYLKGKVRFTSAEGEGTTFYAWYPLELEG